MTDQRYPLIGSTASQRLRDKFAGLDVESREALRPVLERTGCWRYLTAI